jgi:hypothetical protein
MLGSEDTLIVGNDKFITTDHTGNSAHWRVWGSYGHIYPEHLQLVWSKSDDDLIREAKDEFYNNNDVDSLLNAVEAPDFVTGIKSMYNNVNAPVVPSSRVPLLLRARKLTKFISGGYLYYSFGVAPLISDMRKLSKATASYSKRMQRTLATAGTVVSVHRSCGGSFLNTLSSGGGLPLPAGYGASPDNGMCWRSQVIETLKPLKTVTIRGIREHKYMSPLFQSLDNLATRFGSIGPASFAWERLPFSFVADWFVDGSDVFNKLDNFLTGSRKNIQDGCISYKYGCVAGAIKQRRAANEYSSYDGLQTAVNEIQYYHRKPIDTGLNTGLSGRFGKKQIALTGALLSQMAANLKLKR